MTHYLVLVLVNPDSGLDVGKCVEALLAPYDEQLKGPGHEEDCPAWGARLLPTRTIQRELGTDHSTRTKP